MSIKATTYYEVECDDCGIGLGDISDYSSWRDPSEAIARWEDADGFATSEWALCADHSPRCIHGYGQPSAEDDEPMCAVCADEIGAPE